MSNPLSVILFTTSQCPHCIPVKKSLEELKDKYTDDMVLITHVVDKSIGAREVAKEYQITGVPTTLLIFNGEEIGKVVGSQTKEKLNEFIQGSLQSYVFQEPSRRSDEASSSVLRDTSESPERSEGSNQDWNRPGVEL